MKTIRNLFFLVILGTLVTVPTKSSFAHCEIPCGIYEDTLRINLIKEHIGTIEKSMNMIIKLSAEETPNYNQIVRWVINKEEHAKKIQDIISQYFLHQRIIPVDPSNTEMYKKYIKHLTLLHELLVYSMKAKQTTDLKYIGKLDELIHKFEDAYFHKHEHEHEHEHKH